MRAKSRELINWTDDEYAYERRISKWKDNITTYQDYIFLRSATQVEDLPMDNIFTCHNCEGKIVHYEIRDILYTNETKLIESPFSFGHNMEIEWQEGNYFNKVYQQISSDKIIIKYKPTKSIEEYHVRLYDPIIDSVDGYTYIYSNCTDVNSELTLSSSKLDLNCMKTCTGKEPLYKTVTKTKKEPVYKNVTTEACCPYMNITCYTPCVNKTLPCKNNYCKLDTHQVIDHYIETKYNVSEQIGYKCRIGIKVGDKTYDDSKGINVVDDKTLVEWNVPQADRNYDEYGSCRDYEREKGTCTETKLEVSAII